MEATHTAGDSSQPRQESFSRADITRFIKEAFPKHHFPEGCLKDGLFKDKAGLEDDMNFDSIDVMDLILELETRTGRDIPEDDLRHDHTMAHIYQLFGATK